MATSASQEATENNRKLFRRYGKKIALTDPDVYTSHADKLSLWLNDFKAYYTSARPEIVKLLLIAQMTLRRALGLPEHLNSPFNISEYSEHPMVKSYINLVKAVEPFEHYFIEPGLLAHIRSSLALVSPHAPGSNQPTTQLQSDIQTHSNISESLTSPTSYFSETPMASAPNILPVVATAQVKAKKRKAVDFDLLVQRDIKALLEKQGDSSQHVTEDLMVTFNSPRDPPPSQKTSSVIGFQHISAQDACEDQKMAAPDPITDSLPCQDMSASAESQGTSPPVCEDQKMADSEQITEPLPFQDFAAVEPQGTSPPGCEDQKMAGPDQVTEPLPSQDTSSAAVEPQGTSEDQIMAAPDQIAEPLLSQDTCPATEPQGTSSQVVAEDREMTPSDSVRGPSTLRQPNEPQDYSQTIAQDQEMEAGDTAEASLPSLDAGVTEPQNSSRQLITEEQEKQEMAAGNSGDSASLPSQKTSSAIEAQGLAAMSISDEMQSSPQGKAKNLNPLVSSNHAGNISSPAQDVRPLTPSAPADNLVIGSPRSTIPACRGKFGQEMRIVAHGKGLRKDCTMTFTCFVSSALFPKVSDWLNRNIFSLNISESLCLSLGCYSVADLQEDSVQNNTTLQQKISVARSYWPQRGGLSMNVQFKNRREDLPLSPPFQVTSDGLVDVSQFLLVGENVITLKQTTDMSQCIFVLHSHHPTQAQLQEVDERRMRDKEWQEWVRHVSRPFDILSNLSSNLKG